MLAQMFTEVGYVTGNALACILLKIFILLLETIFALQIQIFANQVILLDNQIKKKKQIQLIFIWKLDIGLALPLAALLLLFFVRLSRPHIHQVGLKERTSERIKTLESAMSLGGLLYGPRIDDSMLVKQIFL